MGKKSDEQWSKECCIPMGTSRIQKMICQQLNSSPPRGCGPHFETQVRKKFCFVFFALPQVENTLKSEPFQNVVNGVIWLNRIKMVSPNPRELSFFYSIFGGGGSGLVAELCPVLATLWTVA